MASLREAARDVLEEARGGIAWIAIWKTGRSWHSESFYDVEYDEGCSRYGFERPAKWTIEEEAAEKLAAIAQEDPHAILVNPYYDNLGTWEDMTLETLIDGIKFQYLDIGGGYIPGILEQAKGCGDEPMKYDVMVEDAETWANVQASGTYVGGSPDDEIWQWLDGKLYRCCFAALPLKEQQILNEYYQVI